jgi:hypothetical protein
VEVVKRIVRTRGRVPWSLYPGNLDIRLRYPAPRINNANECKRKYSSLIFAVQEIRNCRNGVVARDNAKKVSAKNASAK